MARQSNAEGAARLVGLFAAAALLLGCGDGGAGAEDVADGPADGREVEAATDADATDDAGADSGVDGDTGPACVYDDSTEDSSYCHGLVVDVSRDVPGGGTRVRYAFDVTLPDGEHDMLCMEIDSVTIRRGSTVVRTGAARPTGVHLWQFVLDGPANADETAACGEAGRVEVFSAEYHGRTAAGAFRGTCNRGGGTRWPPEVTLACHTGVEASLARGDASVFGSMSLASVDLIGGFGNSGTVALTGFTFDAPVWKALGSGETHPMPRPPWDLSGPWWDRPTWEDRADPGAWHWVHVQWSGMGAVFPSDLCAMHDDILPTIPPPSQIVMSGSHSAGAFVIESHPVYCFQYP